jgi:hypothetical protein
MFRILFISIWLFAHPVHITFTSIEYMPGKDSFNVFVKMYFDDFLTDCKLNGNDIQNKDFSAVNVSSQDIMEKYLTKKIILKANDKILTGKIMEMKLNGNEINLNLGYGSAGKPKTVTVKNLILTDLYDDQSNMIIMKINELEEGVKLTSADTERIFELK